jgi:hypothetical protein
MPAVEKLPPRLRSQLAEYWTNAARMEHASIAAFARLVLELLAVGAPHDLVAQAERAMADETTHARLTFGLASAYAGSPVGPGRIAIDGCLDGADVGALVATTFAEGCIGETVAALEASEASRHARDPALRAILEKIALDEGRHAEHAWRAVAWGLTTFRTQSREAIRVELARAEKEAAGCEECRIGESEVWLAHGIIGDRLRAAIRRTALRDLVSPLALALLEPPVTSPASQRSATVVRHGPDSLKKEGASAADASSRAVISRRCSDRDYLGE